MITEEDPACGLALLPWERGPALEGGEVPPLWCGDRFLIAVALVGNKWDYQVITATETGWDSNGESWGDWSIDDVWWFVRLDRTVTKEQLEAHQ